MERYLEIIKFIYRNADEDALKFGIHFAEIALAVIVSIIGIIILISMWKIFKKSGQKAWKCLIPVYNLIVLYKISGMSPVFLLSLV